MKKYLVVLLFALVVSYTAPAVVPVTPIVAPIVMGGCWKCCAPTGC